jgi:ATP-dependent Clp protease ATP-binding subunit ClpC
VLIEPDHFLAALTKVRQLRTQPVAEVLKAKGIDLSGAKSELELVPEVLTETGVDPDGFRRALRSRLGKAPSETMQPGQIHRSERSRIVFQRAEVLAKETASREVTAGHLFIALLAEKDSVGCRILTDQGVELERLAGRTRERMCENDAGPETQTECRQTSDSSTPFLDRFGRDLTVEARKGKLGPVIGRREEMLEVIRTLARSSKNNPVLIGEAGVGKTAVVEGLAVRAAQGKDPEILGGRRIVELSLGALTAGTKHRGDFEERLEGVLREARENPNLILFIDELHMLMGAGSAGGGMDAANLMKPALARGELRCIGATTVSEYRRYVEADAALERRFEKVLVEEPDRETALEILKGLRTKWEQHHRVGVAESALEAAVDLAIRFDPDHRLPDKAIDLVDKACARRRVPVLSLKWAAPSAGKQADRPADGTERVVPEDIVKVVSEKTGIPEGVVTGAARGAGAARLLEMESGLKGKVIGQDEAVHRVCERLLLSQGGLRSRRGPLAVLLFLGPTGVGKTQLAQSIAEWLFGSLRSFIRLDMSEYMEEHSVSKLVGSPPGYVGHEGEGQLTGKLRSAPHSVVLLDEIEKAHVRVFDLFLQLFDEGRLTDSKGRTVDGRHAMFILTSNIPADRHLGFRFDDTQESRGAILEGVRKRFRPEFVNRIDAEIVFRSLGRGDVRRIAAGLLDEIAKSLQAGHNKTLSVSDEALDLVAAEGYNAEFGVRHLRRTIETRVSVPLSRLVLSGELANCERIRLVAAEGRVCFQSGSETAGHSPANARCCDCGVALAKADLEACGWIGGLHLCPACKRNLDKMAMTRGQS